MHGKAMRLSNREEANMMMRTVQSMKVHRTSGYIGSSGFRPQGQNRPWELTDSLSAAVTPITESTSVLAGSCITQGSREGCAEDWWKRLLCLDLPPGVLWES
jgi:hypothetical protein